MRILGLDQSSNKTGFAIYENEELIKYGVFDIHDLDEKHNGICYFQEKIENNLMFIDRLIKEYKIDLVCIEDIQSQSNVNTYKKLAWLQGSIMQYLYDNNFEYSILSPSEWRKVLNIKGKSRKREDIKLATQQYVTKAFGIEVDEDTSDAICIGQACDLLNIKNKLNIYKKGLI